MIRHVFLFALAVWVQSSPAVAQVPHIIGSWKLNGEASSYPGPLPQSQVRTYAPLDDGFLLGVVVTIDAQGTAGFLQFAARPDGLEYPEYDNFLLAELQMSEKQSLATYSEQPVNDRTVEWVDKFEGEISATGTRQVSADGQSLVIEFEMRGASGEMQQFRLVYDKQ